MAGSRSAWAAASIVLLMVLASPTHASGLRASDLYVSRWDAKPLAAPAAARDAGPAPRLRIASTGGAALSTDPNERFNRLWLRSHAPGASQYEGSEAGRKLVQMWVRDTWNRFGAQRYQAADYLVRHLDASREYTPHYSHRGGEMDYRLSLSEDDVELKLHYSFY